MASVPGTAVTDAQRLLEGWCLCTAVRYECGPLLYAPTLCHCESCRRAAGAHAVGWLTVARASLRWSGEAVREYESSPGVHRGFCGRCGTPLSYRCAQRAQEID